MQVSAVDDPRNPFTDPSIRLRNAIIFGLLRYTGMRRGELLSLRIDQFDFGNEPLVWVRRNQDDHCDSRRHQPVAKTKERPLPMPGALAAQIQGYVMNHRANVAPARKHPYLLVSHRKGRTFGTPLSQSALGNQIMQKMRQVDPAFSCFHPHAFRHHFNYELSRRIDEHNAQARKSPVDGLKPITDANELDMRAFLNGQRSRASGLPYNQRHIRESSDKAMRNLQNAIMKSLKGNGNDESAT
jgi:integrase